MAASNRSGSFPGCRPPAGVFRVQKKLSGLRHDEFLAGKLMFHLKRAAGSHNAKRIVQVQAHGKVAWLAADIDGRGDHRRRENSQNRCGGKIDAYAPKIKRQRNRAARLEQRHLGRAAYVNRPARCERNAGLPRMNRHDATVGHREVLRVAPVVVPHSGAAFDGNIGAFDVSDDALLLGPRETRQEQQDQGQRHPQGKTQLPAEAGEKSCGRGRDLNP